MILWLIIDHNAVLLPFILQKTAIGFAVAGAVIFGLGFGFPRPSNSGQNIVWRTWRGAWDVVFCGDDSFLF